MFELLSDLLCLKAPPKGDFSVPESLLNDYALRKGSSGREQVFSKVFRWRLPDRQTREPVSVEVVGSFTNWQKVPLTRTHARDAWHVIFNDIPNNRTHHYMILVDGKPAYDKYNDGLALPQKPEEKRYQIMTDKGPRVFMLFAQTK